MWQTPERGNPDVRAVDLQPGTSAARLTVLHTLSLDVSVVLSTRPHLSVLAATLGDRIVEIDINPLIAGPDGCIAVDALVVGRSVDHRGVE